MELYGITVSTNYDDLLNIIIHQNYKFFTKWYIITCPSDSDTIDIVLSANYPNIELLFYNFKSRSAIFDKGGAVRYGQLHSIEKNGPGKATLLLDSDIYLPDNFLEILSLEKLDDSTLYGVNHRYEYGTLSSFRRRDKTHPFGYGNSLRNTNGFHGFFQLFIQTPEKLYKSSVDCSQCDLDFHKYFREKKGFELTVCHLGKTGINWKGRKSHDDFVIDE